MSNSSGNRLNTRFGGLLALLLLAACGDSHTTDRDAPDTGSPPTETDQEKNPRRVLENLDRGLIAVQSGNGWLLSWRLLGTEYGETQGFNVYKDGRKLNEALVVDSTSFLDSSGTAGTYTVRSIDRDLQ